jgi:hypothetical protein
MTYLVRHQLTTAPGHRQAASGGRPYFIRIYAHGTNRTCTAIGISWRSRVIRVGSYILYRDSRRRFERLLCVVFVELSDV